jgi:AraC-like DNA-binding protein
MVNVRQGEIRQVGYNPPPGKAGEVEAETVAQLLARAGAAEFATTQRLDFHVLLVVTRGRATHMVDFTDHELGPGSALWIRAGQVQRWGDLSRFDAYLLGFPVGLLDPETDRLAEVESVYGPRHWQLTGHQQAALAPLLDSLLALSPDTDLAAELRRAALTHLLGAFLLRLVGFATEEAAPRLPSTYVSFRDLVEERFARDHSVKAYADALGWSTRTLARVTRQAVGTTPKRVIDDRVLLEARRLLAHTDRTVARIGSSLGFDDRSNFTAWFEHRAGMLPSAFRAGVRQRG